MAKDFYEVLGLTRTATLDEIEKAYKKKAWEFHPDRNLGNVDAATEKFKEIQNAYETLSNSKKKTTYDNSSSHTNSHSFFRSTKTKTGKTKTSFTFEETTTTEGFFGGSKMRGRNIQLRVEVDLEEVVRGCSKIVKVKKRKRCIACDGRGNSYTTQCLTCKGTGYKFTVGEPILLDKLCSDCDGKGVSKVVRCLECSGAGFVAFEDKTLNIQIPSGISEGMSIRLTGEGEEAQKTGGINGDVLVVILIKSHPIFRREGSNLLVDIPISYPQCVLGCQLEIPLLHGEKRIVDVPAGSQSNTRFRLKNQGLPDQKGRLGDLIATIKVESPKVLTDEYRQLLTALVKLDVSLPKQEAWLKKMNNYFKKETNG